MIKLAGCIKVYIIVQWMRAKSSFNHSTSYNYFTEKMKYFRSFLLQRVVFFHQAFIRLDSVNHIMFYQRKTAHKLVSWNYDKF